MHYSIFCFDIAGLQPLRDLLNKILKCIDLDWGTEIVLNSLIIIETFFRSKVRFHQTLNLRLLSFIKIEVIYQFECVVFFFFFWILTGHKRNLLMTENFCWNLTVCYCMDLQEKLKLIKIITEKENN